MQHWQQLYSEVPSTLEASTVSEFALFAQVFSIPTIASVTEFAKGNVPASAPTPQKPKP